MKIFRAVEQGLEIPENLDDLVLSEDEKEVSNKQDIEMIAENNEAAKSTEWFSSTGDIRTGTDRGYAEPVQKNCQTTDSDHDDDRIKQINENRENPGFLITVIVKQENKLCFRSRKN